MTSPNLVFWVRAYFSHVLSGDLQKIFLLQCWRHPEFLKKDAFCSVNPKARSAGRTQEKHGLSRVIQSQRIAPSPTREAKEEVVVLFVVRTKHTLAFTKHFLTQRTITTTTMFASSSCTIMKNTASCSSKRCCISSKEYAPHHPAMMLASMRRRGSGCTNAASLKRCRAELFNDTDEELSFQINSERRVLRHKM